MNKLEDLITLFLEEPRDVDIRRSLERACDVNAVLAMYKRIKRDEGYN